MLLATLIVRGGRDVAFAERFAFVPGRGSDPLPKLWHAPDFSLIDQRHEQVTLDSLRGRPFVVDFIFTECTSACPMVTASMVALQRRLRGRSVQFVSFSVDPARDTPEVLAAYAKRWNADESRWSLLSTTPETLKEVASGFRVTATPSGDHDNPISHSQVMLLVDSEGFVRGVYHSVVSAAMSSLGSDAEQISEPSPPSNGPSPDASTASYATLGCAGCHENPKVAPPLLNLRGAERTLKDGSKVTVDDPYLRRAILEPARDVVAGYSRLMPSYRTELTDDQVDTLIAELDARKAPTIAAVPNTEVKVVTDPVCHMKVRTERDAPHVTHEGKEVYFCSETCRTSFLKNPTQYRLGSL
jgi:cytochrome oxidase Cu insertion factor (SCO1/SenC/PrrC family)/YHS domain-containing protein